MLICKKSSSPAVYAPVRRKLPTVNQACSRADQVPGVVAVTAHHILLCPQTEEGHPLRREFPRSATGLLRPVPRRNGAKSALKTTKRSKRASPVLQAAVTHAVSLPRSRTTPSKFPLQLRRSLRTHPPSSQRPSSPSFEICTLLSPSETICECSLPQLTRTRRLLSHSQPQLPQRWCISPAHSRGQLLSNFSSLH